MAHSREKKPAAILIVDRDPKSRHILKRVLMESHPEYRIREAGDSADAFDAVRWDLPDLIFLDVVMPDNEGFDLCLLLKADERTKDIPLVILTELDQLEAKVKGFRLGASDYLVKPFNKEETVARVEAQLRMKSFQDRQKELNEELRRTQSALLQSSKMSAAGTLAAGVAHEFNNILHVIGASAEVCSRSDDLDEIKRMIAVVLECAHRGGQVAKGLLDFARKDDQQKKERVNLSKLVKSDLDLLAKRFEHEGVTLELDAAAVPEVECFPGQISQIFVNLAHNALDSMRGRPERRLKVSVRRCACPETACRQDRLRAKGDGCVLVTFEDSGCGIPESLKEKLFEPFVTTKGVLGGGADSTPGTGLGLSISYGIARRHGGQIRFESEEGSGARFTLSLPVNAAH